MMIPIRTLNRRSRPLPQMLSAMMTESVSSAIPHRRSRSTVLLVHQPQGGDTDGGADQEDHQAGGFRRDEGAQPVPEHGEDQQCQAGHDRYAPEERHAASADREQAGRQIGAGIDRRGEEVAADRPAPIACNTVPAASATMPMRNMSAAVSVDRPASRASNSG